MRTCGVVAMQLRRIYFLDESWIKINEDKPVEQVKDEMYESASEFGYLYEFHDTDENLNDNEDNE
jgi:hypothetical protein